MPLLLQCNFLGPVSCRLLSLDFAIAEHVLSILCHARQLMLLTLTPPPPPPRGLQVAFARELVSEHLEGAANAVLAECNGNGTGNGKGTAPASARDKQHMRGLLLAIFGCMHGLGAAMPSLAPAVGDSGQLSVIGQVRLLVKVSARQLYLATAALSRYWARWRVGVRSLMRARMLC